MFTAVLLIGRMFIDTSLKYYLLIQTMTFLNSPTQQQPTCECGRKKANQHKPCWCIKTVFLSLSSPKLNIIFHMQRLSKCISLCLFSDSRFISSLPYLNESSRTCRETRKHCQLFLSSILLNVFQNNLLLILSR